MAVSKEIVNRKAKFEYEFLLELDAGIMLTGTEVKALRDGNANLTDAYCMIKDNALYIRSMYIGEYDHGNIHNHETRRERKLLLRKTEIKKLDKRVKEKGFTIVPYKVFWSDRGLAKIRVILGRGKKEYSKKESIKERDANREMDRVKKYYS